MKLRIGITLFIIVSYFIGDGSYYWQRPTYLETVIALVIGIPIIFAAVELIKEGLYGDSGRG